jgi:plastocyanin
MAVPILVLATVIAFDAVSGPHPTLAGQVWNVRVGDGGQGVAAATFFPGAITIHSGDTIHFLAPDSWEPHTVTSIPDGVNEPHPYVGRPPKVMTNPLAFYPSFGGSGVQSYDPSKYYNSGFLFPGDQYNGTDTADVSFSTPGTYTFFCLLHSGVDPTTHKIGGMHVDVTVVPQGSSGPTSQADIDAAASAQRTTLINAGVQALNTFPLTQTKLSDGSTNWGVTAGGYGLDTLDPDGVTDIAQFTPSGLSVNTGDTVTWTNDTGTFHTITFLSGGPDIPLLLPIAATGGGPPNFEINPSALEPAGGPTYDGTGYVNSGFLDTEVSPFGSTFSLTFTKAGTYQYICHLHDQVGMIGTINVTDAAVPAVPSAAAPSTAAPARPETIAPPDTGTGPPRRGSGGWLVAIMVLGMIGATFALAGTRLVGRRTD